MPNIVRVYDGSDRTQSTSDTSATTGTVASATDQQYTGGRSLKLSTGAGPTLATARFDGVLADAGRRISFRFRTSVWTSNPFIVRITDSAGNNVFGLQRNSGTGVLTLAPTGGTGTQSGTTAINANTWHRIVIAYTVTSTSSYRFDLHVDGGAAEASATNVNCGTMTRTGTNRFVARAETGLGTNADIWVDDLYIDDGSSYGDPGDYRIPFFSLAITGVGPTTVFA